MALLLQLRRKPTFPPPRAPPHYQLPLPKILLAAVTLVSGASLIAIPIFCGCKPVDIVYTTANVLITGRVRVWQEQPGVPVFEGDNAAAERYTARPRCPTTFSINA
jgi:hypothetical protein